MESSTDQQAVEETHFIHSIGEEVAPEILTVALAKAKKVRDRKGKGDMEKSRQG